jgi:hypothetical protein
VNLRKKQCDGQYILHFLHNHRCPMASIRDFFIRAFTDANILRDWLLKIPAQTSGQATSTGASAIADKIIPSPTSPAGPFIMPLGASAAVVEQFS